MISQGATETNEFNIAFQRIKENKNEAVFAMLSLKLRRNAGAFRRLFFFEILNIVGIEYHIKKKE